jgi:lipopolysaccharide/colanic/teichoic acid biosynthesis glycosyltransferase
VKTSIELRTQRVVAEVVPPPTSIFEMFVPYQGWYLVVKAVLDWCAALVLLILLSPIMLVAAIAVKLTSRGPVFYRQLRSGLHGEGFYVWKFRTMVQDAEAGTGAVWSTAGDPRITPIGKILRDSHIDEFPQLFNVLCGSMSMVGPRPERPEIAEELETVIPAYRLRIAVRPGITGFAQIRLPADTDLDSVRRKLAYDLYYIQNMSPLMDSKIVVRTALNFIWSLLHITVRTARLPREEVIEKLIPHFFDESTARETFVPPHHLSNVDAAPARNGRGREPVHSQAALVAE